ncbi:hypothetical protein B296_00015489, partial [Ensete ventricosum]
FLLCSKVCFFFLSFYFVLLQENTSLLKLLAERNEIIRLSSIELQKLELQLQKTNQQNWQLARANSQMLAELNLGKDRLKALHHELSCTRAALKLKTSELEVLHSPFEYTSANILSDLLYWGLFLLILGERKVEQRNFSEG